MDSVWVGATLLPAAVFALAGMGKLLDLEGSRRAVAEFGVPEPVASPVGVILPFAELLIAVLLVLHSTTRLGAFLALGLLLAFVAGIANQMRLGRAPDCGCFGVVHSERVGRGTLIRNGVLAAIAAALVIHGPGPSVDTWVSARSAAELVAFGTSLLAVVLAAAYYRLWSQNRELKADLVQEARRTQALSEKGAGDDWEVEGLPAGDPAPSFALPDLYGGTQTLRGLLEPGRPVVLFFMEYGCGPCKALLPEIGRWQEMLADRLTIVILSVSEQTDAALWEEHSVENVLSDRSKELFKAYNLQGTPKAILIAPDGTVAGGPAGGMHMPEVLIRSALRRLEAGNWSQPVGSLTRQPELLVISSGVE